MSRVNGETHAEARERLGLEERKRAHTREEIEQEVQQERGPFPFDVVPWAGEPEGARDRLDAQVVQLQQGVPTRSAPGYPGAHYLGYSHAELHAMVNTEVGPSAVDEAGVVWTQLGNSLAAFTDEIVKALLPSETQWTGEAGDKARQAMVDFGNSSGEAGRAAQLAGGLFAQQARALADVKNQVPPPPAVPFDAQAAAAHRATITDPVVYAQQAELDAAQFAAERAAHEEAARRVEAYDRTTAQIAGAQPAFAPPPPAPPPQPTPGDPIGLQGRPHAVALPPQVGDQDRLSKPDAPPAPDGQKEDDDTTDTTYTSGTAGPDSPPRIQLPDEQRGSDRQAPRPGEGVTLPPARIGADRPRASRSGGGGGGAGSAARVPGSAASPGSRNAQPGQPAGVARATPGVAAEVRGPVAKGQASPVGVGGVAGAQRGPDDEDIERTTKYLEPTDEFFLDDERQVAPPVLGE